MKTLAALAVAVLSLHLATIAALADAVSVTQLPQDVVEVTGSSAQGAHTLRITKSAGQPSWSDSRGNTFLADEADGA